MPLIVEKAARRKPAYVDGVVPEPALRRAHRVAVLHEPGFARAFMRLSRSIYDPSTLRRLRGAVDAMKRGELTVEQVVATVDWFNPADPLATKQWELLGASLEISYTKVVEDAGNHEARAQGWPLRVEVQKRDTARAQRDVRVPINPFSIAYVREQSVKKVREISDQQRGLLREILVESFEEGQSSAAIVKDIEATVGLLSRERQWVANRRQLLIDEGANAAAADKRSARYAAQLLTKRGKRIARTETIDAYSQGLADSWQLAREEGFITANTMKQWVELTDSDRTCEICRGLARQAVPVDQPFMSDVLGAVDRPPAHPHCRCTSILVLDVANEDIEASNRDTAQARDTLARTPTTPESPRTIIGLPAPLIVVDAEAKIFDVLRGFVTGRKFKRDLAVVSAQLDKVPVARDAVRSFLAASVGPEFVEIIDTAIDNPDLQDSIIDAILDKQFPSVEDAKEQVRIFMLILKLIARAEAKAGATPGG